ncbi:O-antigen/teichoic acid export membrane protein [Cereibacter azotoformans]|uniref:O-antigen/teichoic acid export membrane protein n=2 Tax=Cereibacter azotoformans TaxID=43057 RepID=A0A2T5JSP8_9RHOB|nr:O-antigen/teichoic acid export membrane protein [Cereibacter azotoformans]
MLWVAAALGVGKLLSLISQIFLGHVLSVETYAIFGMASTAVALTAGFQNPNVGKALIQSATHFPELFIRYSAFAFQFGLIGSMFLIILGWVFAETYDMPQLCAVLVITGLSVPLLSVNTTLAAGLSLSYRFRDINTVDIKRSLIYYFALVSIALLGAEALTMAVAMLIANVAAHLLLLRQSALLPSYFKLRPRDFAITLGTLRWVILSSFLAALAMRSDYFVLGKMLNMEEMGYYTFAIMLVASLTLPISTGITQVFLPIFARLQGDEQALLREVQRFSAAIVIIGSVLCLLMLGMNAVLIHLLWGGKWDLTHFVVNALAMAMPFRFLGMIAGVGLEAIGRWRLRNGLLAFEAVLLSTFAAIGAALGGLNGAIAGTVVQFVVGSFVGFYFIRRVLCGRVGGAAAMTLRLYAPFVAAGAMLLVLSPSRHGTGAGPQTLALAASETLAALVLFSLLTFLLNRTVLVAALNLVRQWIARR